jgi:hypothetical protein
LHFSRPALLAAPDTFGSKLSDHLVDVVASGFPHRPSQTVEEPFEHFGAVLDRDLAEAANHLGSDVGVNQTSLVIQWIRNGARGRNRFALDPPERPISRHNFLRP